MVEIGTGWEIEEAAALLVETRPAAGEDCLASLVTGDAPGNRGGVVGSNSQLGDVDSWSEGKTSLTLCIQASPSLDEHLLGRLSALGAVRSECWKLPQLPQLSTALHFSRQLPPGRHSTVGLFEANLVDVKASVVLLRPDVCNDEEGKDIE